MEKTKKCVKNSFGKITLYWNRRDSFWYFYQFLIKMSILQVYVFDQKINRFWSKYQIWKLWYILRKISNLMKRSNLTKISKLRKMSNLTKISKLRKMLNFNHILYLLHLPHLLPSFGFVISFFLNQNEIYENWVGTNLTVDGISWEWKWRVVFWGGSSNFSNNMFYQYEWQGWALKIWATKTTLLMWPWPMRMVNRMKLTRWSWLDRSSFINYLPVIITSTSTVGKRLQVRITSITKITSFTRVRRIISRNLNNQTHLNHINQLNNQTHLTKSFDSKDSTEKPESTDSTESPILPKSPVSQESPDSTESQELLDSTDLPDSPVSLESSVSP